LHYTQADESSHPKGRKPHGQPEPLNYTLNSSEKNVSQPSTRTASMNTSKNNPRKHLRQPSMRSANKLSQIDLQLCTNWDASSTQSFTLRNPNSSVSAELRVALHAPHCIKLEANIANAMKIVLKIMSTNAHSHYVVQHSRTTASTKTVDRCPG